MSRAKVLVVDDEQQILRTLEVNLRGADYDVETAESAAGALSAASRWRPDAIILDLVLPDGRGAEVCHELRTWSEVPVVVLSVVDDSGEKIAALDAGADDYVTKPFEFEELLARLRAVLRRSGAPREPVVRVGEIVLDLEKRAVTVARKWVRLTRIEFELLRVLVSNCGKLLSHRALLREVWGPGYGAEFHYLHVYVSQLRRKIECDPTRPRYLLTEVGTGYRFVDPSEPD